jgi:hypothetical protein
MLFDIGSGRKKRVVQVIYGALALLFLVGFVGFGVGSEVGSGGIADIFTGNDGGDAQTQFADDADDIEKDLEDEPRNKSLLVELIGTRYSAGNALLEVDEETGIPQMTEDAEEQYEGVAEAWDRYLALKPGKPNTAAATYAVSTFQLLAQNAATENEADANWNAAADAQEILAKARPNVGTFSNLAFYSYAALDFKRGNAAAKRAASLANNDAARKRVTRQLTSYRKQAQAFQAQRETAENAGDQGGPGNLPENPLSDIAGGADALSPSAAP